MSRLENCVRCGEPNCKHLYGSREDFMTIEDLEAMERDARREAERRGWLTGDINQTDKWFRD